MRTLRALGRVLLALAGVIAAFVVCLPHFWREYQRVRLVKRHANTEGKCFG